LFEEDIAQAPTLECLMQYGPWMEDDPVPKKGAVISGTETHPDEFTEPDQLDVPSPAPSESAPKREETPKTTVSTQSPSQHPTSFTSLDACDCSTEKFTASTIGVSEGSEELKEASKVAFSYSCVKFPHTLTLPAKWTTAAGCAKDSVIYRTFGKGKRKLAVVRNTPDIQAAALAYKPGAT